MSFKSQIKTLQSCPTIWCILAILGILGIIIVMYNNKIQIKVSSMDNNSPQMQNTPPNMPPNMPPNTPPNMPPNRPQNMPQTSSNRSVPKPVNPVASDSNHNWHEVAPFAKTNNNRQATNPSDLLPMDPNTNFAMGMPSGQGELANINLLKAGQLSGINTVGSTLRNANLQLRSEPPNPRVQVSPWSNSTIEPDLMRVPLELGYGGV